MVQKRAHGWPCAAAVLLLLLPGWSGEEKAPPKPEKPATLLGMLAAMGKQASPLEGALAAEFARGDLAAAEKTCRRLIQEAPFAPNGYYNLGCILARRGQKDAAFEQLEAAVARGFNDAHHIQRDSDLLGLHDDPRFRALVDRARTAPPLLPARPAVPLAITDREAWVKDENIALDKVTGLLRTAFRFEIAGHAQRAITTMKGEAGDLLRQWQKDGSVAGNVGDLYDNCDGDHSDMQRGMFPQLTWIEYSPEAKAAGIHWGLQDKIAHRGVVIGNASVAQTQGSFWRSMSRMAYGSQRGVSLLYLQYTNNQMYFYPCHVDHSPGRNGKQGDKKGGHGDVFPVNTPYLITSQGSSGSDQVFLQAVACTLAAFRPDVKRFLAESNAIAPTVQMIFRLSNKPVKAVTDYLTGVAHPTVFQGSSLDPAKMVRLAHEMKRESVPPLVKIKVTEEERPALRMDFFDRDGASEVLFDTPCAVARAFRGTACRRRLTVSAEDSCDLNKRPLTWHWAVLRGDPEKITIRPLNESKSRAEITLACHPRRPVQPGETLESNRVDIGVFVHNGTHYSAPAFVTFFSLDNEERVYDEKGRIRSVTYTGADEPGNYVDPVVALPKSWRDEYHYDGEGRLTGWTRHRGNAAEEFTPDGKLIVRRGADGKAEETRAVRYVLRGRGSGQPPAVVQQVVEEAK